MEQLPTHLELTFRSIASSSLHNALMQSWKYGSGTLGLWTFSIWTLSTWTCGNSCSNVECLNVKCAYVECPGVLNATQGNKEKRADISAML